MKKPKRIAPLRKPSPEELDNSTWPVMCDDCLGNGETQKRIEGVRFLRLVGPKGGQRARRAVALERWNNDRPRNRSQSASRADHAADAGRGSDQGPDARSRRWQSLRGDNRPVSCSLVAGGLAEMRQPSQGRIHDCEGVPMIHYPPMTAWIGMLTWNSGASETTVIYRVSDGFNWWWVYA